MNYAEHTRAQVRWLAEEDHITRMQLVEIVEEILLPYVGHPDGEAEHFRRANDKIHLLLRVSPK